MSGANQQSEHPSGREITVKIDILLWNRRLGLSTSIYKVTHKQYRGWHVTDNQ